MSAQIISQSVQELNVFTSAKATDELVDLSQLFGATKMVAGHSQEYLDSFTHMAVFWDSPSASSNLYLDDEFFDARYVKSMTS